MNFTGLETPGARIVMTVGLVFWLGTLAFVMHITGHDPGETGRTLLSNAFTSLFTLVIAQLSGKAEGSK